MSLAGMTATTPIDESANLGSAREIDGHAAADGLTAGRDEIPLPSVYNIFQGGLFVLAVLAALYAARGIILPIVFASMLKLLLHPVLRALRRFHVPAALGALLLIAMLFLTVVAFGTALSGPATAWAAKLPDGLPRLTRTLKISARAD